MKEFVPVLKRMVLIFVLNIFGVFLMAKLFPLPQGQGFATVPYPLFALFIALVTTLGFAFASWMHRIWLNTWFWLALGLSWLCSLVIFNLV